MPTITKKNEIRINGTFNIEQDFGQIRLKRTIRKTNLLSETTL